MNPIAVALGEQANLLSPALREHILQVDGARHYRGVMRRIWIGSPATAWFLRPALWLISRMFELLIPVEGFQIPFDLVHEVRELDGGKPAMGWARTFYFPHRAARFNDVVTFQEGRLMDWLGRGFPVAAELCVTADHGAMVMESVGRQWLNLGHTRIPLPPALQARARVREWEDDEGFLQVDARLWNPVFGPICGYRGWFTRDKQP